MELNKYQELAMVTRKPHPTKRDQVIDALLGIAGESGEVCDYMKKHFARGIPLDQDTLVKELGDVLWYIAEICDAYGIEMNHVAQRNIEKLSVRHGAAYKQNDNRTGDGK